MNFPKSYLRQVNKKPISKEEQVNKEERDWLDTNCCLCGVELHDPRDSGLNLCYSMEPSWREAVLHWVKVCKDCFEDSETKLETHGSFWYLTY